MAKARGRSGRTTPKRTPARKARPRRASAKVSWLAKGYPLLSPVTILDDCAGAIDWYKKVFGAKQRLRLDMPGGLVAHSELGFGDAVLMLASPMPPEFPARPGRLMLYVKDCDAMHRKAVAAGAHSLQEPADQFYGDRNARFRDPFGNDWTVMTHIKDVTEREMKKAMAQMGGAS